jgi:hypothetical protein
MWCDCGQGHETYQIAGSGFRSATRSGGAVLEERG